MKLREIILDFTSLLDVFMLILFFFILFSHFEVEEAKSTVEQVQAEAQQMMSNAEAVLETAESMLQQAEDELTLLYDVNHGKAVDMKALMQISRGTVMQSKLTMHEDGEAWTLEFRRKDEESKQEVQLAVLDNPETISQEIIGILQNQSFQPEDKIPFIFIYDGTEPGSETAFSIISTAFREVKITYPHFYDLELDISDFGE